ELAELWIFRTPGHTQSSRCRHSPGCHAQRDLFFVADSRQQLGRTQLRVVSEPFTGENLPAVSHTEFLRRPASHRCFRVDARGHRGLDNLLNRVAQELRQPGQPHRNTTSEGCALKATGTDHSRVKLGAADLRREQGLLERVSVGDLQHRAEKGESEMPIEVYLPWLRHDRRATQTFGKARGIRPDLAEPWIN